MNRYSSLAIEAHTPKKFQTVYTICAIAWTTAYPLATGLTHHVTQTGSNILRCCRRWIASINGYAPVSHLHAAILHSHGFAQFLHTGRLPTTPNCSHPSKTSIEIVSFAPPLFRAQPPGSTPFSLLTYARLQVKKGQDTSPLIQFGSS
jgi:hypothetical protein